MVNDGIRHAETGEPTIGGTVFAKQVEYSLAEAPGADIFFNCNRSHQFPGQAAG